MKTKWRCMNNKIRNFIWWSTTTDKLYWGYPERK